MTRVTVLTRYPPPPVETRTIRLGSLSHLLLRTAPLWKRPFVTSCTYPLAGQGVVPPRAPAGSLPGLLRRLVPCRHAQDTSETRQLLGGRLQGRAHESVPATGARGSVDPVDHVHLRRRDAQNGTENAVRVRQPLHRGLLPERGPVPGGLRQDAQNRQKVGADHPETVATLARCKYSRSHFVIVVLLLPEMLGDSRTRC